MARPLRIEFDGAFYHVTSRGNARQNIYLDGSDYLLFLDTLTNVCKRYNWLIHAYCLMTNHYHLVVETPEGNLSLGMRQLNGVYTQRFNRKHGRVGHIFQGRFKSILVDSDSYYITLIRYVIQNPLRANMVKQVGDYSWSSYNSIIGKFQAADWLQVDSLLKRFAQSKQQALLLFSAYIDEPSDDIWSNVKNQVFLGSEAFVQTYTESLESSKLTTEFPNSQMRSSAEPLANYQEKYVNRNEAICQAYLSGAYTLAKLAEYFGLHYSTVSRIIAKNKT